MNASLSRVGAPRLLRPVFVSALVLALVACASNRGLEPQGRLIDADALQSRHSLAGDGLSQAGWPALDWWHALGDPQLDALIDEGLRGTPGLDAALARLRQAQAQAGLADAARRPSLSVSAGYTGVRLPESMVGDELGGHYAGSGQAVLDFSYGIDLWGGKRASWEAALGQARAAEVDAQAARLDLSSAIVETYAGLDHAWRELDLANEELARSQKTLELTRQRRDAGIDSDLQVRQAQARVPAARQQAQAAQLRIDQLRSALAALLGQGPDRGLRIARPGLREPLALPLPDVLPAELLGHRPDVVAARWRVEAADRDIDAARTRFYPSLDLTALGGLVNADMGRLLRSESAFGLVAPALSLPIFDGGRLRANLAGKDAQYDLLVADYNGKVVQALREVADQIAALRSLDAQLRAQDEALAAAVAAHAIATQRHGAGIGSFLDVLSAQQQLLVAQQRMSALQSQQLLASVQLRRALGGGFSTAAGDVPGHGPAAVSTHS